MTSFYDLLKSLTRPKLRIMNRIVLIDVIAIVLTLIYQVYRGDLETDTPLAITLSYSVFVAIVAFVLMSRNSEHIFVSDAYRLIPASDTKLYSVNLLSSFIGMVYAGITQVVLWVIAAIPFWGDFGAQFKKMFHYTYMHSDRPNFVKNMILLTIGTILLAIAMTLLLWASITLIHLTGNALTAFLPDSRQKFFRFILYIVVIVAFLYIFSIIENRVDGVMNHFFSSDTNSDMSLYYATSYLLGFTALESVGSVYLLKHWVETDS
ncbi:ABC transporter permease [Lentilactobacillus buchneri]|uniref:ABC transporter permease n=1 Tax=Lentilactobacillus buchneri TaxID=1581 RepID=UPI0012929619|nr:ABC transporter permease [Lentilactobacillus buchneri]MQN25077.1 ABC transporter permease [Lentilactobacillus buchneri]